MYIYIIYIYMYSFPFKEIVFIVAWAFFLGSECCSIEIRSASLVESKTK